MGKPLRTLIVEDSEDDYELILRELRRGGYDPLATCVDTPEALEAALDQQSWDIVISDYVMPRFSGLDALKLLRRKGIDVPFILVSGAVGEDIAVAAMRAGAHDYLMKHNLTRLVPAIERELKEAAGRHQHRNTDAQLAQIINNAAEAVIGVDEEQRILLFNQGAENIFGYRAGEVLGQPLDILLPARFSQSHHWHIKHFAATPETSRQMAGRSEIYGRRKDGEEFFAEASISKLTQDGRTTFTAILRDISERKRAEEKIKRISRMYAVLSGINGAIVRSHDRQELFEEACRIAVKHGQFEMAWIDVLDPKTLEVSLATSAGIDAPELLTAKVSVRGDVPEGQGVTGRALREKRPVFSNNIALESGIGSKRRETALRRGLHSTVALPLLVGEEVVGSLTLYAKEPDFFNQEELKLLTELAEDISFALDHIEKAERLNYLAYYDVVTGLANRALFHDRLNQFLLAASENHSTVALLRLELEQFRVINETFGRQAGDALLKQVAERLRGAGLDAIHLARTSAGRFAVVLEHLQKEADVVHILERRINDSLRQPFVVEGTDLHVSAKTGIALFPADGADADSLLRNATAALEKAKLSGDRYLFYTPELNARVAEKLSQENKLRRALEREQFVLYYQPKVSLKDGHICALEALIRWNDPDTGLVPPGMFIPILEETGMILDVGRWALRQAVADTRCWIESGLVSPRVAVNVSSIQLRQKDFVNIVESVLNGNDNAAQYLDLEITESLIMQDIEETIQKLKLIRAMGVEVAIDDFGTGYSSLSYITKLPVNTLKIDRAFIINMTSDPGDQSIVSAIISLAHSLKLKVVAEGVETQEQANLLRLLKCHEIQGYLFSPAVPAEQIGLFLKEKKSLPM